ncbi:MAG: YkvA family protein [Akkermansia sp.]
MLFPIDLIPDFIPGVGQIDDLTVIAFTFLALFMPPIREHGLMKTRNPELPPRTTSHADPPPPFSIPPPLSRWPGCRSDRCAGHAVLGRAVLHHRPGGKTDGGGGKVD